jgi:hypothetical protein
MADLISRLRLLIGDPAGGSQVFADQELQDALDLRRDDVRYLAPAAAETIAPGGTVQYLDYYADRAPWEADEALVDGNWATLTPASADRVVGRWTFAASTPPPVYVTGKVYDLYAAAADVLEAWAATVKLDFTFTTDGQQFTRAQKFNQIAALAADYRRRSRPQAVRQVRSDLS